MRTIEDALEVLNTLNSQGRIEYAAYSELYDAISMIDVEPVRHGHWIMKPNGYGTCSNCKMCSLDIGGGVDSDYCPNCGAKMDEVKDDL